MEVEIPFNKWSRDRIKDGKKRATSRDKAYGTAGDHFFVCGKRFEITMVVAKRLGDVCQKGFVLEGTETPEEFRRVWLKIYRRFEPNRIVLFHVFAQVD